MTEKLPVENCDLEIFECLPTSLYWNVSYAEKTASTVTLDWDPSRGPLGPWPLVKKVILSLPIPSFKKISVALGALLWEDMNSLAGLKEKFKYMSRVGWLLDDALNAILEDATKNGKLGCT